MKERETIWLLRETVHDPCQEIRGVVAACLLGSRAKGQDRPDSDIDLAFLFDRVRRKEDRFEALRVAGRVMLHPLVPMSGMETGSCARTPGP
jgi:predicted nucleotidyltransferase